MPVPVPPIIPRCNHIKTNGLECGSPALSRAHFCYFHQRWREQHPRWRRTPAGGRPVIDLPLLEDANAIQLALQQVAMAIASDRIDNKKAGLLLFALQTASANLKRTTFEPQYKQLLMQEVEEPNPAIDSVAPAVVEAADAAAKNVEEKLENGTQSAGARRPAPEAGSGAQRPAPRATPEEDAKLIEQFRRLAGVPSPPRRPRSATDRSPGEVAS